MDTEPPATDAPATPHRTANRYDLMEWAGAFGDFGTLIPFVAAYIGVLKLDPFGVLFAFGASMVVCGLYYKTPFPVQPMKAIGAVASIQAVQTAVVTPAAVHVAAVATGLMWLVLGLSGLLGRLGRLVPPTVVAGIVLGLGFGFMLQGVKMMQTDWLIAVIGAAGALLLKDNRKLPAMFALLGFGAVVGGLRHPELLQALKDAPVGFTVPSFAMAQLSWNEVFVGVVLLALPQMPLTLGNAVMAITEENNRLFPSRPVSQSGVATSTGIMNTFSGLVGGVPMCHGAGGMAAHMAFGARTGGSVVILGGLLLSLALLFSGGVHALFQLFPAAVLGVVLFLTGLQLATGVGQLAQERSGRVVVLVCAGLCMWNVAAGFGVGVALHHLNRWRILKL
jgi:MFS superfamily sulfate permease-like transporter